MPFLVRFYKRYGWLMVFMFLLIGSFMLEKHVHSIKYLLVALLAVCFADQKCFGKAQRISYCKNAVLNKLS